MFLMSIYKYMWVSNNSKILFKRGRVRRRKKVERTPLKNNPTFIDDRFFALALDINVRQSVVIYVKSRDLHIDSSQKILQRLYKSRHTKSLASSLFLGQGWPSVNTYISVRHLSFNQPIQDSIAVHRSSLSYICVVKADYGWKQHGFGIPCFGGFVFRFEHFFWLKQKCKPYYSVFSVKIVCA